MPDLDLEFTPVSFLKINALGKPGERTFYIQGGDTNQVVTLLVEKFQLLSLALGTEEFVRDLEQRFPELPTASAEFNEDEMVITPPVDPIFRVGEMNLGFDASHDHMVLILSEVNVTGEDKGENPSVVRFWCERSTILGLAAWIRELIGRGRVTWPSTGDEIAPPGEFSPRNNGHKH